MTLTLVADGSSDKVLIPILTWSLKRCHVTSVVAQSADLTRIPRSRDPKARVSAALDLYPCDLLFIHRDAEAQPPELRRNQIAAIVPQPSLRYIPVIPVRMTEAWLLANEAAIRSAAGNPSGVEDLNLPEVRKLESLPDPKKVLHDTLRRAAGLNTRRSAKLNIHQRVHLIPNYIDDYSVLDVLPAFQMLQKDIGQALHALG